jgi:hypothetical protein
MKNFLKIGIAPASLLGAFLLTSSAQAQTQVYSENFDTDKTAEWNVNSVGNLSPADIFFDYSTVGIPAAPHSTGGTTRGLKLQANLPPDTGVFPSGVSVSPKNFGITENFEMHWDMWINVNGPFPGGGSGSTQIGGGGYGTAGDFANVAGSADCIFIGASGDGGTASDVRVYSPGKAVGYQDLQYILGGGFFGPNATDFQKGDPQSGFVFAGDGSRNSGVSYYATNFPGQPAPAAQLALYPQQTGTLNDGALGMKWHDVSITKIANTITYKIDGVLMATVDAGDATIDPFSGSRPLGGTNIMFNHYDINAGNSTDPNAPALAFSLIDNVRITNFPNVVGVEATAASVSETAPSAGTFAITRTSAGVPLTVNYTLTGSASNGVDYVTLPGSVTFDASQTTTNITVTPIDDSVTETTETVILSINASSDYVGAGNATVRISDNESPQLAIVPVYSQAYERAYDYARYRITRLGDTNAGAFTANVTFSGNATLDTDFTVDPAVTFAPGDESLTFDVHPIEDADLEGNETIVATLAPAGSGEYTIGTNNSATVTVVDAATPPETVLFSDNFETDSTANWTQLYASAPDPTVDSVVMFNYDYASFNSLPPAPHSNGDTHGLYLTVNKNDFTAAAAALNLYPIGQNFSGNYALRFDMYLINGNGASATEYALFGVNHSGTKTNWFRNSTGGVGAGWAFDGIFYDIEADGTANGDYVSYSAPTTAGNNPTALASTNASELTGVFKSPPWAAAGAPSNIEGSTTPMWAEVEVSQLNNVLTLKVNNTVIFSQNNSTGFTDGNIMLGYEDAYDSIGPVSAGVIYDNVRVVALVSTEVKVSQIQKVGSNIQIDFTADGATATDFTLESSADVAGTYTNAGATIISTGGNNYRATVAVSGDTQFYRIHRQ